ncbi:hypothetical protein BO70DRAFT_377088 [Aspergillus heteromorphus CBS 117.55]|uniref:BZIP domain-containing protein n=1 Tax=Aspergillus heteromorphus CBS 117.55 TaxID=1448321 RepID=A0A317WTT1_9EURO|nr:uncharacterized protein BO70DRAFT_377088 [Aspergillus heteromorphus CBS 117.55]PWY89823.1 hypothetical protein BO70DRAFT_377088 [Aspergillus heteromorphus CBS 117.55]
MRPSVSATILQPGGDDKRLRRRIQNRLNQRARRFRVKKDKCPPEEFERVPYKVHRWRLGDGDYEPEQAPPQTRDIVLSSAPSHEDDKHDENHSSEFERAASPAASVSTSESTAITTSNPPTQPRQPTPTLPADHLLHLIYSNVFRGLYQNKLVLEALSLFLLPGSSQIAILHSGTIYPTDSIMVPVEPNIPDCLTPIPSQSSLAHSSWIDLIPFPQMRENLITWESCFDHADFVRDLVGGYGNWMTFRPPSCVLDPAVTGRIVLLEGDDDEVTTSRRGFLVWGEPHRAESWEVTPGFLRKWSWAVEGCEGLIESSNRWRMARGEEPMRVSRVVV